MKKVSILAALTQAPKFTLSPEGTPCLSLNLGARVGNAPRFVDTLILGEQALTLRHTLKAGMVLRASGTLETVGKDAVPVLSRVQVLFGERTHTLSNGTVLALRGDFSVVLEGNLARKPSAEIKERKDNSGSFLKSRESLATRDSSKDASGQWVDGPTVWVNVKGFDAQAEEMAALDKGTLVRVVGQLEASPFDGNDGIRRNGLEVKASRVIGLRLPKKGEALEGVQGVSIHSSEALVPSAAVPSAAVHAPEVESAPAKKSRKKGPVSQMAAAN